MKPTPNPHRRPKRPIVIPDAVAARAATKFEADEHGCWISTYSVASHGYAQVGWRRPEGGHTMVTAHRAAWVYHHGQQIPEGMTIDHTCKERRCVNPSHLRMLSNFENARRTAGRDWPLGECANGHSNDHLVQEPSGKWKCGPCSAEQSRRWDAENAEKRAEAQRRYRERNPEKVREAQARYRARKRAEAYPGEQHLLGKKGQR